MNTRLLDSAGHSSPNMKSLVSLIGSIWIHLEVETFTDSGSNKIRSSHKHGSELLIVSQACSALVWDFELSFPLLL